MYSNLESVSLLDAFFFFVWFYTRHCRLFMRIFKWRKMCFISTMSAYFSTVTSIGQSQTDLIFKSSINIIHGFSAFPQSPPLLLAFCKQYERPNILLHCKHLHRLTFRDVRMTQSLQANSCTELEIIHDRFLFSHLKLKKTERDNHFV